MRWREFWEDVRAGHTEKDAARFADWMGRLSENIVSYTVVFCAILMVGSCAMLPIAMAVRGDKTATTEPAAKAEPTAGNPWMREDLSPTH